MKHVHPDITGLPLPFVTNIMIDTRAADVHIEVDPALIFAHAVIPGEVIPPEDRKTGVALNMQKGSAVSIITLMENEKAAMLVEALVTCIVRGDPDKQKRAEGLLARFQRAITAGFESPAPMPGHLIGCVQEGGDDAQKESEQGRTDDRLPGCTPDDLS